ncbi:protein kinase domain-containing protein [Undibacterium griseum]|uniref:Serine/threonine protein kinase n=1 Tax=Undibacterium griseum TaxID=2762295 RepID=A0ABR6YP89_9BURK|nr:serine/threonine-protein kinase [Undibacterium griseum]MBC3885691.1 serine/threonine protein kinase [Undibacterium griseum]
MELSGSDWQQLSGLFDEAMDLDPAQRQRWLERLAADHPPLHSRLCQLLAAHQQAEEHAFLLTAPKITLHDGAHRAAQTAYAPGMHVGPWELKQELGKGGMASVWLAVRKNGEFKREIALKLPFPDALNGTIVSRFIRERDILSQLTHPYIARLYDAGISAEQQAWLALEYVRGEHIIDWCQNRQLGLKARLQLMIQVCSAVQYAHSHLVVHRDLKPGNILVTEEGDVRLLDFGIAQILQGAHSPGVAQESALPEDGTQPITWRYASPEQIRGEAPGIASDVYSLGVVFYELLTGSTPYQPADRSRRALEQAILHDAVAVPSSRVREKKSRRALRGDLDAIIQKALKKTPQERYATVDAFADDLKRYLSGDPVRARPDSLWYRSSRLLRKHRWIAAGSLLFTLSLFIATAVSLHQARIAQAETIKAKAMYQFVVSLFNPDQKPDLDLARRQMTLKELVSHGVDQLMNELHEHPDERARLLHDLGQLSVQLGLQEEAARIYTVSLQQAKHHYGSGSNEYASVLLDAVEWLSGNNRSREACQYADQALAIYQHNQAAAEKLAVAYRKAGHCGVNLHPAGFPQDIHYLEMAVQLARSAADQAELSTALENLGLAYLNSDRPDAALQTFSESLALRQRLYGPHAWQTAESQQSVAISLDSLGRTGESEAARLQALQSMQEIWGRNHYFVSESKAYLADMLVDAARRPEGLAYARSAYDIMLLPDWRHQKLDYLENASASYLKILIRSGSLAEARKVCDQFPWKTPVSYPILRNILLNHCGTAYLHFGDIDTARRFADDNLRLWQQHWPNQPSRASGIYLLKADIARAGQHHVEAIREYQRALHSAGQKNHYAQTEAWLGLARLAGADQTLLPLTQMQAELNTFLQPGQREYWAGFEASMREALGNVYLARGETQTARAELEAALAIREKADDTRNGLWYALTLRSLASILQSDNPQRARQLRQQAAGICRQYPSCQWEAMSRPASHHIKHP